MKTRTGSGAPAISPAKHAGVWLPPPLIYLAVFVLALFLQAHWRLPAIPEILSGAGGPVLIAAGVLLSAWSIGFFRRARTSLIPMKPTTALVIAGPYRFTRNPMYLSLVIVYLGAALLFQILWAVLLTPLVVLAVQFGVVRKEERYLHEKFGEDFSRYQASVRRWI
ncbi:MAG: isoprenylcysteine carboxylmethyltransferase family protein [Acidobacteriia bacterium]|nr:isoprenylcysteine carboxylmethyltransferase family protein [Terriglobia bacterium]